MRDKTIQLSPPKSPFPSIHP